jgi:thioredoxin reductase (NADPH)
MLNIPGEEKFFGHGVSTCAVCDAAFYRDKNVFVVGGGDSAMEDTMALVKFASNVTIIHRRNEFKASKIMQNRVINHPKVKVMWNSELVEIIGEDAVEKIKIKTGSKIFDFDAQGVFLAIGHKPVVRIFKDKIALDAHDYIITRQSLSRAGLEEAQKHINDKDLIDFPTMTSVEGVFAGGDVVDVRYKQAITAAGQGCEAALDAERWLESQK